MQLYLWLTFGKGFQKALNCSHAYGGVYEYLNSASCHLYHCKKSIPYSQRLRYNRNCSDNENLDQPCNDLEKWLIERSYSKWMDRTHVNRKSRDESRCESRNSLLERDNTRTSEVKLTFNINYYTAFQNVRKTFQKLQIILAPDKEYKKVFPEVLIVRFRNGKNLKDYLVRAALAKMNNVGGSEPYVGRVLVKCLII